MLGRRGRKDCAWNLEGGAKVGCGDHGGDASPAPVREAGHPAEMGAWREGCQRGGGAWVGGRGPPE